MTGSIIRKPKAGRRMIASASSLRNLLLPYPTNECVNTARCTLRRCSTLIASGKEIPPEWRGFLADIVIWASFGQLPPALVVKSKGGRPMKEPAKSKRDPDRAVRISAIVHLYKVSGFGTSKAVYLVSKYLKISEQTVYAAIKKTGNMLCNDVDFLMHLAGNEIKRLPQQDIRMLQNLRQNPS
jgi:hypothetical protein